MPTRRILGIDPGTVHFGVGCIEKNANQLTFIHADVIDAPQKKDLYSRIEIIFKEFKILVAQLAPAEVAVEDVFCAKNARSAFHLGLARGAAIAACLERGLQIHEYAPTQVKSIVTGYGRADKAQIKKMTELTLGQKIVKGFDATDALAVAICHAYTAKFEARC